MTFQQVALRGMATASKPRAIKAGLILSRIPIVTQEATTLEKQYYEYQSELERRLMWTFPQYFYFRKGTLSEKRFLAAQRGPVSRQPGVWFPKGVPDVRHNRERRTKQEVTLPKSSESESLSGANNEDDVSRPVVPNSRITDADRENDTTSLERQLSSTLYLIVKNAAGKWAFPSFSVPLDSEAKKPLHITAEAGLRELGGPNINTWTVSNTPAGVLGDAQATEFMIKSHIVSGRFVLQPQKQYDAFAWLTKSEIQQRVEEAYFKELSCILADN